MTHWNLVVVHSAKSDHSVLIAKNNSVKKFVKIANKMTEKHVLHLGKTSSISASDSESRLDHKVEKA